MNHPFNSGKNLLLTAVLALGLALSGYFSGPAEADTIHKLGLTLKKNLGSMVTLDQTLFNVKVPLNISKMPGPWKNAKLKGIAMVYFLDGSGEAIGAGLSENGEDWVPLDVVLNNGNYNGTVVFPIQQSVGTISGKNCSVAMIIAQMGNQTMFIGASTGGTAPNSGPCGNMCPSLAPGTILP
ncbi:MAG: hypothetical protein JXB25_10045 [Deltaproteobacteria bacterium]|nr:hypothetical protein [Deltaproteobacteria bacterium]